MNQIVTIVWSYFALFHGSPTCLHISRLPVLEISLVYLLNWPMTGHGMEWTFARTASTLFPQQAAGQTEGFVMATLDLLLS